MKRLVLLLCLVPCLGSTASAQTQATQSSQAIAFVQSFYDWYLPIVSDNNLHEAACNVAIKRRPELFDQTLLRALQNDAVAQANSKGEIDNLDFDPFVDTNGEPAPHFKAVRATGSLVTVVGFDKQIAKPLVTLAVEVRCKQDRCVIVNIHYPAHDGLKQYDLLSQLRLLHPPAEHKP
jgi:hypothetical protein